MDYKEFLEDYKETLSKYCYATGDFPIRKNEEGEYFVDAELTDCMYVMGGHFDIGYVIDEIKAGDFPFEGINKEGWWHIDFLLKYIRGDYEEPSYMEQLLVVPAFQISFEDAAAQQKEISDGILPW